VCALKSKLTVESAIGSRAPPRSALRAFGLRPNPSRGPRGREIQQAGSLRYEESPPAATVQGDLSLREFPDHGSVTKDLFVAPRREVAALTKRAGRR
jgi:hypothetical protein